MITHVFRQATSRANGYWATIVSTVLFEMPYLAKSVAQPERRVMVVLFRTELSHGVVSQIPVR